VSAGNPHPRGRPPTAAVLVLAAILLAACGSQASGDHARHADQSAPRLPQFAPTPNALDETPSVGRGGVVSTHVPWMPAHLSAGFGSVWVESHRGNATIA
jgi:hypothetical protein